MLLVLFVSWLFSRIGSRGVETYISPGEGHPASKNKEAEMSALMIAYGRIAHGTLGPQADFTNRRGEDGQMRQELFRRCHVFVTDRAAPRKEMPDGSKRSTSHLYQLIFDSGPRHEKIFEWLRPGRLIAFRGRLDHRSRAFYDPNEIDPATGKPALKVHANPRVYVERIDFLDSPVEHTAERFLSALVEGKKITAEQKAEMVAFLKENLKFEEPAAEGAKEDKKGAVQEGGKLVEDGDPFEA